MNSNFSGYKIVQLNDCTREVARFYKEGSLIAIMQKNGYVALSGTGIFNHQETPIVMERVAKCFYGLKLINKIKLETYINAAKEYRNKLDTVSLEYEAKRLGFKLDKK